MKEWRTIISIDIGRCDGCGRCVVPCPDGALRAAGGKAEIIADKFCDGCGQCLDTCPPRALEVIEREADLYEYIPMGRC